MKSMKVRKLAALGVAAAVAAVPVAFAAMHSDTLPTDRDWYLQSKVVVGANAIASDVVAAAEIAAAIAGLAYKGAEIQGGSVEDATVKLSVPGEIVVSGDGKSKEYDMNLMTGGAEVNPEVNPEIITPTDVSALQDSAEISYRIKKSGSWNDETAYASEKIYVDRFNAEGYIPEGSEYSELRAETDAGKVRYELQVRGLDFETNKTYTSDELDGLKVKILGKEFEVTRATFDANGNLTSIELAGSKSDVTVNVGESTEYEGYQIKVADIDKDNQTAYLQLIDDQGNVVADDTVRIGGSTDFDGKLSDGITVEGVFAGENLKFAKIGLKSNKITISDTSTDVEEDFLGAKGWELNVSGDNSAITFTVTYQGDDEDTYLSLEKGLKEGEAMKFPGDSGLGVLFAGLTAKPMKEVKFDGDKVVFLDGDGAQRTAKLAFDKTVEYNATTTVSNILDDLDMKIKFDNETNTLYYDADMKWESGENITKDQNVDLSTGLGVIQLDPDGDGDAEVLYLIQREGTTLHFLFGGHTVVDANAGSDLSSAKISATSDALPYRVRLIYDDKNTTEITDDTFYWRVSEQVPGATDVNIDITPEFKDTASYLFDKLDFEKKAVQIKGDVADYDDGTSSVPRNSMTPYVGTEIVVEDSDTVDIKVPTEPRKVKFFFGVVPQTIETTGAIEAKVGETVQIGDYEVKIEGIEGVANVQGTYYEKLDFDPVGMAILDTEADNTGNLIVVGGWNANQIAAKIKEANPEIESELEQDKEIIGLYTVDGQEIILVAGWEAQDTRSAARNFIAWLKENVQ